MGKVFNVRAYGILVNEKNEVLLSDEFRHGIKFTKFPGGGLEWGEGLKDCLVREFEEETLMKVRVIQHFYTTDFFQKSAFSDEEQLISVYYLVELIEGSKYMQSTDKKFDFKDQEGAQNFRWVHKSEISESHFSFPVDQVVAELIRKN